MSSNASTALLERIRALAASQFGGEEVVVATPVVGSLLHEDHFDVLADFRLGKVDDPEKQHAIGEILQLVDCVQDGSMGFIGPVDGTTYLGETYKAIVGNAEFKAAGVDPAQQEEYEKALAVLYVDPPFQKTPAYAQFTALRTELEQKGIHRKELTARLATLPDGPERQQVESELAQVTEAEASTKRLVDALNLEHSFEEAEVIRKSAGTQIGAVPASVANALANFELWQVTDANTNESHPQCDFVPSRIAEDNWVSVVLDKAQLAEESEAPEDEVAPDHFATLADDLIESVEAEVQILGIDRQWFWRGLFENRNWDWRTPSAPVSTGDEEGEGLIPAFVTGVVLARNLVVRGTIPPPADTATEKAPQFIRFANILTALPPERLAQPIISIKRPLRQLMRAEVVPATRLSRQHIRLARLEPPAERAIRVSSRVGRIRLAEVDAPPIIRLPPVKFPPMASLDVAVSDPEGRPVPGATVEIVAAGQQQGPAKTTEATGSATFDGLVAGDYSVMVRKVGFAANSVRSAVNGRTAISVPMTPLAPAEPLLTVKLRDPQGNPPIVPRGAVVIRDTGGAEVRREPVGDSGELAVRLPAGSYAVEIVAPDARSVTPQTADVALTSDLVVEVAVDSGVLLFNGDIHLVGFVCRRVPRCPHPAT